MPLQRLRRYPALNIVLVFGLLLIVLALWTLASRGEFVFFTPLNLAVLAQQIPVTAIVAIGVGLLMLTKGLCESRCRERAETQQAERH